MVDTGHGVGAFFDFAGQAAINDGGRGVAVAGLPLADTDAKNGEIDLVGGRGDGKRGVFVGEDFVRRNDFAELPVVANFNEVVHVVAFGHVAKTAFCEVEEHFGETIVREANNF